MTTSSSKSAGFSVSIGFALSAGFFAGASLSASAGSSASASLFTPADLIFPSSFAGLLLPVVLDMTKPFHIRKPVTSAENTTAFKTLKGII